VDLGVALLVPAKHFTMVISWLCVVRLCLVVKSSYAVNHAKTI